MEVTMTDAPSIIDGPDDDTIILTFFDTTQHFHMVRMSLEQVHSLDRWCSATLQSARAVSDRPEETTLAVGPIGRLYEDEVGLHLEYGTDADGYYMPDAIEYEDIPRDNSPRAAGHFHE